MASCQACVSAYIGWDVLVSTVESMSWQSSGGSSIKRNAPASWSIDGENLSSSSLITIRVASEDLINPIYKYSGTTTLMK